MNADSITYQWVVPNFVSDQVRLVVQSFDVVNLSSSDTSDVFSVFDLIPPEINVLDPTSSSSIQEYGELTVNWIVTDNITMDSTRIYYSNDGGENWLKKEGNLPKILIPVHLSGQSAEMIKIKELSNKYNFKIIEDASHSIGASYDNSKVGSCKYSDITVFSFHPVKIITTCEGGVAITNDAKIAKRLDLFRTHGITKDFAEMHTAAHGPWYYEQLCLGLNYRMTEIQATIGRSQLKRVDDFVSRRNALATIYDAEISKEYFEFSVLNDLSYSSYHLYVIKLKDIFDRKDHRLFFEHLRDQNIGVNIHYIPVHFHPYYKKLGFNVGDFPNAENYYHRAISIPLFYGLEEEEQLYVIDKVNNYFK